MKNKNNNIYVTGVVGVMLLSAVFVYARDYGYESKPIDAMSPKESMVQKLQEDKAKAEQVKDRAKMIKADIKDDSRDRVKKIREELKVKIDKIKDEKKQDMANKIIEQIDRINESWTKHFSNVLNKLEDILKKVKSRQEKASANGQDVSAVITAVQKAESAIATARSAVSNQAQKTYAVNVSTITGETSTDNGQTKLVSTLRERFKLLKDQLFKDLFALRDGLMKDARNAVHEAARTLSQVPNVDKEPAVSN